MVRSARSVPVLAAIIAAADRLWWARTILRADVVDTAYAASQGLPRGRRRAVWAYVSGAFRDGASLNPLFLEQLVSSQLSDAGRVPALYAYLVNDARAVETSVSWDAPAYAETHPESTSAAGGPLGHAWRAAGRSGRIELGRGDERTRVAWGDVMRAATPRRSHPSPPAPFSGIGAAPLKDDGVAILRIGEAERELASALRLAIEIGTTAVVAVAPAATSAHREASLLPLWLPRVTVHTDDGAVVSVVEKELMPGTALVVRGPRAEVSASDLLTLATAAVQHDSTVAPLWLDQRDGTVAAAGVFVHLRTAYRLLAGHPAEDAGMLVEPIVSPGLAGETFARPAGAPILPVRTEPDIIVRAPVPSDPRMAISNFDPTAESDLDATLAPLRMRVADWSGPSPAVARLPARGDSTTPRLRWAIKIVAPPGAPGEAWGDTHFARGVAGALRRLGQEVVIDAYDARSRPSVHLDDVVLALRGPEPFTPQRGAVSAMWIISHPDEITADELRGFDLVFAGSTSWARSASSTFGRTIRPLLQCTDARRFRPHGIASRSGIVFVGTARGIERPSVLEPIRAGIPVSVYGPDWRGWIPASAIAGTSVPNAELPAVYEAASVVLNDHWPAMQRSGFVSNRLYDVVAAGGRAISDDVEGIDDIFEGAVKTYRTIPELIEILNSDLQRVFPPEEDLAAIAARVRQRDSFDARARTLLDAVLQHRAAENSV